MILVRAPFGPLRCLLVFFLATWLAVAAMTTGIAADAPPATPVNRPPATERFRRLTIEDGLSQSTVVSQLQDHEGYLWFGTQDGLNRYDGYEFRVFRADPNQPGSLAGNRVYALFEDQEKTLWVGTNGGLSRYDRSHGAFVNLPVTPLTAGGAASARVNAIVEDRKGTLWIGTNESGVAAIGANRSAEPKFYRYDGGNPRSIGGNRITGMTIDPNGTLWFGTTSGLCRFRPETNDFERFYGNSAAPAELRAARVIRTLAADREGRLWLSVEPGALRFDPRTGACDRFLPDPKAPLGLSNDFVQSFAEDRNGDVWIGTLRGLDKYETRTNRMVRYNRTTLPDVFDQDDILSMYQDRAGALWIGLQGNGLILYDPALHPFRRIVADPGMRDREVRAIYEDKEGIFWIGVSEGLRRYDPVTGTSKLFLERENDPTSLPGNRVYAVHEDRAGNFWVATEKGLARFDRKTETFTRLLHDRGDPTTIGNGPVRVIYEDRAGELWFGTSSGISRLDRATGKFTRIEHDPKNPESINSGSLRAIYEDRAGRFWIGTAEGGIGRMDRTTGKFRRILVDPKNPKGPASNYIYAIHESGDGLLWIGTGGGLHRFNPADESFEVYSLKEGLPSAAIYGVLEDRAGTLWFGTNAGLARFDPRTKRVRVYDRRDGLFNTEYTARAFCKSRSGEMFFGGTYGVDAFKPETIVDNPFIPPVVISGVRVFDDPAPDFDGKTLPPLKYNQNLLTFDFAALCFTVPEKNRYRYKLENFDPDWREGRGRRTATYTNLDPGEYVFHVQGSNNDGVWNEQGARLRIVIKPPPWRTWWAYSAYFIGFIILVAFGVRFQAARLAARTRMREIRLRAEAAEAEAAVKDRDGEIFRLRNVELAEANRTITDSIAYARTIQQAILPAEDALRTAFGDVFVLYRPRDIVSGDFYWIHENEKGMKFIAVADCTGHGVPGAFMSVIGASLLDQIVIERNLESPAEILTELHAGVRRALRQDAADTAAEDGLDLALCRIEPETVTFAGARRPLYAVDGAGRFVELSGDRASIGGTRRSAEREFRNYLLPREPGMTLYLATDGFADQNGPAGKPFGSRRLRELLRENAKLPLAEQAEALAEALDVHRSGEPQRDDVTVVGLRLG